MKKGLRIIERLLNVDKVAEESVGLRHGRPGPTERLHPGTPLLIVPPPPPFSKVPSDPFLEHLEEHLERILLGRAR